MRVVASSVLVLFIIREGMNFTMDDDLTRLVYNLHTANTQVGIR